MIFRDEGQRTTVLGALATMAEEVGVPASVQTLARYEQSFDPLLSILLRDDRERYEPIFALLHAVTQGPEEVDEWIRKNTERNRQLCALFEAKPEEVVPIVERAIREFGTYDRTAKYLRITRQTLYKWLKHPMFRHLRDVHDTEMERRQQAEE